MCWHPYFHSLIFLCPTHETQFGFWMCTPVYFFVFSLYSKTISISSSWSINKLKTNMCIRLHMWWCCLSLFPLLAGPLVASWCQQLFIESRCHIRYLCQLGTPPCWPQLPQLIRKHCCQGKAWWSRRGEICLSVRLGAPGCPMQCLLCLLHSGQSTQDQYSLQLA